MLVCDTCKTVAREDGVICCPGCGSIRHDVCLRLLDPGPRNYYLLNYDWMPDDTTEAYAFMWGKRKLTSQHRAHHMRYLKYPESAFVPSLTPVENKIYLQLLYDHFRFCRGDYSIEFFRTNRDLADLSGCSTRSVRLAKKSLMEKGHIVFRRGPYNKTHYKITP